MSSNNQHLTDELLNNIDDEEKFVGLINNVKFMELVPIQYYLWDYAIKFSAEKGTPLTRVDLTNKMERTANYQRRVGCDEPIDYCRANFCVASNPNCAGDKLKSGIKVLRTIISEIKKNS